MHFFTAFEGRKVESHGELVNNGSFCLAEPGRLYVIYMPHGGNVTAKLGPGRYKVKWFNPQNEEYSKIQLRTDRFGPRHYQPMVRIG